MLIIMFYVMLVIVITIIGNSRGRGVDGFFISLFFSPLIGLLWVLAMPNLNNAIEN